MADMMGPALPRQLSTGPKLRNFPDSRGKAGPNSMSFVPISPPGECAFSSGSDMHNRTPLLFSWLCQSTDSYDLPWDDFVSNVVAL